MGCTKKQRIENSKKLFKAGDRVRWKLIDRLRQHKHMSGVGVITRVIPRFGNVPWNCEVDTCKTGVLFEDEVKLDRKRRL